MGAIVGGIALATTVALAGCSTGGGSDSGASGYITANGSEPQNPLIPTNTNEVGGGKILDAIFAGLVYYEADGTPVNDLAESITSDDQQTYTIKIKSGEKFSNGEEVTSDSFINAWKDGALLSNERLNSYFFEDIEGFSYDEDSDLTGLKKVDDQTFTVTLKSKLADFPLRLGYSAFYPLPTEAFDSDGKVTKAFGENPIGNGPYKLDGGKKAWQHDVQIDLATNKTYTGGRKADNTGLTIKFYATLDAAYQDLLGGNLDVLDALPESAFSTFKSDLGDRAINTPGAVFQSFTIPSDLTNYTDQSAFAHFVGDEGKLRRQAISYAIDRDTITDKIFDGTRTPAEDFTSPTIAGFKKDIPGSEVLKYDPDKAAELWAQADAISPWSGSFSIAYNTDGGHKAWVDAVCNNLNNNLKGMDCSGKAYPTFAQARTLISKNDAGKRDITTAFRSGWQADYPGLFNFLGPLYATNASSNDGDYSNPEFDKLIQEGSASADTDAANAKFQQAEEILFQDLPAIPLWYQNTVGGYGENVENVKVDWHSVPIYYQITKK
ncbi:ABC transporter substrate-binding protein [Schumannella sp. 10F1B-5-1]|uniref:peptide ABC transporter substrate-binding protein n=1 Tax=Schumannella sp. 10F1B-5-1 TaxID=2590780 RepID=UPI001131C12A|nr:ABC transporter substrate-binding protein [Schumannella sp. 10F1B-5-1]TPW73111.1 ABC transporter substrate-binding protein [Schumannella sp. 10F1B-5-1]